MMTWRLRQNGSHFADNIFEYIFWNENYQIFIEISLKFVLQGPGCNMSPLVQVMVGVEWVENEMESFWCTFKKKHKLLFDNFKYFKENNFEFKVLMEIFYHSYGFNMFAAVFISNNNDNDNFVARWIGHVRSFLRPCPPVYQPYLPSDIDVVGTSASFKQVQRWPPLDVSHNALPLGVMPKTSPTDSHQPPNHRRLLGKSSILQNRPRISKWNHEYGQ